MQVISYPGMVEAVEDQLRDGVHPNPKIERFCRAYLMGASAGNKTEAARVAEYKAPQRWGWQLMKRPDVRERIMILRDRIFGAELMRSAEVLARISRLARGDPRLLYNEDGSLKRVGELDDVGALTLAGIETEKRIEPQGKGEPVEIEVQKVKFRDPLPALALLARFHKDIGPEASAAAQVQVNVNLAARMEAAEARVAARRLQGGGDGGRADGGSGVGADQEGGAGA